MAQEGIDSGFFMRYFLSSQLLKRLSYPFHLTYNLILFLLSTFSILNSFSLVFCNSFLQKFSAISSLLKSLITYVQATVFLMLLTTKSYSDQFGAYPLAKLFLYFEILIWSPILNLGSYLLKFSFSIRITCNVNRFYFTSFMNCVFIFIKNIILHIKINIF